jgi:prepilin-type N-terminal cleavage/methylation domain-containing protein
MIKKSKKGMTLIEIIISIAILGILAVSFLTLFVTGFSGITGAGNRSKAQYNVQTKIEEELNSSTSPAGTDTIIINFLNSTTDKIEVQGKIKAENTIFNGKKANITFFKPNK